MTKTATEEVKPFNGEDLSSIDNYVKELKEYNLINPSTDPDQRVNNPRKRAIRVDKRRSELEKIISRTVGDKEHPDGLDAQKIIEEMVAQGYEGKFPGVFTKKGKDSKLVLKVEGSEEKHQLIRDYLKEAGVDRIQLRVALRNITSPYKIGDLPDDNPLKVLVNYVNNQSDKEQARIIYINESLASKEQMYRPEIIYAFNKHFGFNLNIRHAKARDAFQAVAERTQALQVQYQYTDPALVQNEAVKSNPGNEDAKVLQFPKKEASQPQYEMKKAANF